MYPPFPTFPIRELWYMSFPEVRVRDRSGSGSRDEEKRAHPDDPDNYYSKQEFIDFAISKGKNQAYGLSLWGRSFARGAYDAPRPNPSSRSPCTTVLSQARGISPARHHSKERRRRSRERGRRHRHRSKVTQGRSRSHRSKEKTEGGRRCDQSRGRGLSGEGAFQKGGF